VIKTGTNEIRKLHYIVKNFTTFWLVQKKLKLKNEKSNFAVVLVGVVNKVNLKTKECAFRVSGNTTKQKTLPRQTASKRELKRFSK
jgi:hypothetical protein